MDWRRLTATDRRLLTACLVALAALMLPAAAGASVSDEIVVMRDGGLTLAERAEAGVRAARTLSLDDVEVVRALGDRADALEALRDDPDVVWAEANHAVRPARPAPTTTTSAVRDARPLTVLAFATPGNDAAAAPVAAPPISPRRVIPLSPICPSQGRVGSR